MDKITKRFDTFIFDWDGTLRNMSTLHKLNAIFNPHWNYKKLNSLENYKRMPMSKKQIKESQVLALYRKELKRAYEMEKGVETAFIDIALMLAKPKMHKYAREVLGRLNDDGKYVALFTDGARYRVLSELHHLKAEGYFDIILSAQSIRRLKPDPSGIEIIIDALGSERKRAIYFGDMVDDITTAKEAGVHSAAMGNGFGNINLLRSRNPDYVFTSMQELFMEL